MNKLPDEIYVCIYEKKKIKLPESFLLKTGNVKYSGIENRKEACLRVLFEAENSADDKREISKIQDGYFKIPKLYRKLFDTQKILLLYKSEYEYLLMPVSSIIDPDNHGEKNTEQNIQILSDYLNQAEIIPIDIEKYDQCIRSIFELKDIDKLLPSFSPLQDKLPFLYQIYLFLLQYLPYKEDIQDEYDYYRAEYSFYPEINRRTMAELYTLPADSLILLLMEWAKKQASLKIPVRIETVTAYTPRRRKNEIRFFNVGGAFLGAGEPYKDDLSVYKEIDVFRYWKNISL